MDEEKDGGIIEVQPSTVDFMSNLTPRSLDDFEVTMCVDVLPGGLSYGANE